MTSALLSVLALLAQSDEALLAQLDGLPPGAGRREFLERPALMELIARADRSAPALARALESSPSASVRAAAAYALAVNGFHDGPVTPLRKSFLSWLQDPDPTVRAVVALSTSSEAGALLLTSGETADAARRLRLALSTGDRLDWLTDDYVRRRRTRLLEVVREAPPLPSPAPTWDQVEDGVDVGPVTDSARRLLSVEIEHSRRGHEALGETLDAIRALPAGDSVPAALLLRAATAVSHHADGSHDPDAPCLKSAELFEALHALAEARIRSAREPAVLSAALEALAELARSAWMPSADLLKALASDHPDPGVRERAARRLAAANALLDANERHRRWMELQRQRRSPSPAPGVPATSAAAPRPAPAAPAAVPAEIEGRAPYLVGALVLALLGVVLALALRKR